MSVRAWISSLGLLSGCSSSLDLHAARGEARGEIFDGVECAEELEPNDLEGDYDYDWLGLVSEERSPSLCGEISQTGTSRGGEYDGDFDYVLFQTRGERTIEIEVEPEEDTPIDIFLAEDDEWVYLGSGGEEGLPEGLHTIALAAAEGEPTDYVLTIRW